MMGLLCNVTAGVYTIYTLSQREGTVDKNDGESVVESKKIEKYAPWITQHNSEMTDIPRERAAARIQLVSDLCDLTVPTSALGFTNFDDGFVGLAGTTSSLIGVWAAWKKTA